MPNHKVIAVYICFADGERHFNFLKPCPFDVEAWARSRQEALHMLGVARVVYEEIEVPCAA